MPDESSSGMVGSQSLGMMLHDHETLRVAILNLMPTKIATETQLLRLLSNSALQVEVTLLHTATHESKNTDADHLLLFAR